MVDKWETSVKACGPEHPEHPEWETSVGDKCKIMRPRAPNVGEKCGRQAGDTCKSMRPRAPRVGDKCGRQVGDKRETNVKSCGPVWETSGRHM